MPKIDLLPCPFCGSDNITIFKSNIIDGLFSAGCIKCNVTTAFYVKEKYAAEAWNTRASSWISCSERLPEVDEPVLIYDPYNEEIVVASLDCDKMGFSNDDCWYGLKNGPFWMPLPEAPKRKDDTHDYD